MLVFKKKVHLTFIHKAAPCPKSCLQSRLHKSCFWLLAGYPDKCNAFRPMECAGLCQSPALLNLHSHRHQTGCMETLWDKHVPQTVGADIAGVGQTQTRAAPGIRVPGGRPGYPAGTVCRGCACSARPASDGLTSLTSPSTTAHVLLAWKMVWPTAMSTPLYRWAHPAHSDNSDTNVCFLCFLFCDRGMAHP